MVKYIKCPRCDLNYIDSEKQEYCDVCIAEMKGSKLQFADIDEEELEELDTELEQEELCPVCGVNRLRPGEKVCDNCRSQQEYEEEEEEVDIDRDEEWKNYLEEDDGDLTVDDETLQEEIEEEEEEDEDEYYNGEDDDDPLADLIDDDFDDEDDDDEDDEDDDDEDDDDDDF